MTHTPRPAAVLPPATHSSNRARAPIAAALAVLLAAAPAVRALGGCTVTPSPNWKDAVAVPGDPFAVVGGAPGEPSWVKFTILTCDPGTVYFQKGGAYTFHYDFCTAELDPLVGLDLAQFEAATQFAAGQQAILGAIVIPAAPVGGQAAIDEYGIQLVRQDAYTAQEVIDALAAVTAAVTAGPATQAFYFPTFEQLGAAQADAAALLAAGIPLGSPAQWLTGNVFYASGWNLGRLRHVAAGDIEEEFLAGTLLPSDVLLTDAVPSGIPLLAGVIGLSPGTPNSHIAILADTFDVPYVYLADPDDAARALGLDGRRVVLSAYEDDLFFGSGIADIRLIDVEDELTPAQVDEVLALKVPPPLAIAPTVPFGRFTANADLLVQADIEHFGGKASNFGILRRSIPDHCPKGLGISFDLWQEFMDQTIAGGGTLRQHIADTLGGYSYPPTDMAALSADLEGLRDLIEDPDETVFTLAQQTEIVNALLNPAYGFDPQKKIRFRSSSNAEDSDQFVAAGLYESKSGCLADDLDPASQGFSYCDPTDTKDKGVFRAIRAVYASFYFDNAFLARLRHGLDPDDVGMAVLVHHSFPDEIELANGVATLVQEPPFNTTITLVTQAGAVAVTNPEVGAIPEQVDVIVFPSGPPNLGLTTSSNLVQLGDTVLEWRSDYDELVDHLLDAAAQFQLESGKTTFVLDYEYKKMAPGGGALPPGGLVVKQIRELPRPDTTPSITPFLVNEPFTWRPRQSGQGDVFAVHRAKAAWALATRSTRLDAPGIAAGSLLADVHLALNAGCARLHLGGPLGDFPGHAHAVDGTTTTDEWDLPGLANPRHYSLDVAQVGTLVSPAESPILTLRDLGGTGEGQLQLTIEHAQPVTSIAFMDALDTTTSDTVTLVPEETDDSTWIYQERVFGGPLGATITTRFHWQPPAGFCAGCIFPVVSWEETVIEGLTPQPVVLTSAFAQSYDAGQHNFVEWFLFEPRLDPGVAPDQLLQLRQLGVERILVVGGPLGPGTVQYLQGEGCPPLHPTPKRGPVRPGPSGPLPGAPDALDPPQQASPGGGTP